MRLLPAILLLLLASVPATAQSRPPAQTPPVAFTGVNVIDMTGAPPRARMTVVVAGERIAAVGPVGAAPLPPGARVVDASGKFLIPGLLGCLDSLGTVEPGKLADLVLLDADPLADIRNTRRVRAVVAGGRYFPPESLEKMLADVEAYGARK